MSPITLTMQDDVQVVVPDSLDLMTPYILQEQHDWFEDEIKFLRLLLRPEEQIIDIGANYGVYTLTMARVIKSNGHIWAFEPASTTAEYLAASIAANGFTNITLERCALSDRSGSTLFSVSEHAELNSVAREGTPLANTETVPLATLDQYLEKNDWRDISFVKIDAEGEESNILKGGQRFFSELSPLVMFEIKDKENLHLDLVDAFAALGYHSYRLVPGQNILVPFDARFTDPYLLNLFCCKPDRAEGLAARNRLVFSSSANEPLAVEAAVAETYGWQNTLAPLPYGQELAILWQTASAPDRRVNDALCCYAISRDESLSAPKRFAALQSSFRQFEALCQSRPDHLRLISYARVAKEIGARQIAVEALKAQLTTLMSNGNVDLSEPFLAPREQLDHVPPNGNLGNWLAGGALEELEHLEYYSSFYKGVASTQRLELILALGFGSAAIARRLELTQRRKAHMSGRVSSLAEVTESSIASSNKSSSSASENLHIGGKQAKPGWKILNIQPGADVDYVGDISDLSQFPDGSFDNVYASHVLERVSQDKALPTLREIFRVLKAGGQFMVSVPDLEQLSRLILMPNITSDEQWHVMRIIFGGQTDPHDFHYVGWTYKTLSTFLTRAGFRSVNRVNYFGLFDDSSDICINDTPISVNVIATKN